MTRGAADRSAAPRDNEVAMITKDSLVEEVLNLPGAVSYCVRHGVSAFSCSGEFPCTLGRLLEIRKVGDPEAFIAGLNALLESPPPWPWGLK